MIETHQEGVVIAIKAFPGAKRNEVRYADGCLKVYVTQIPEKGKANKAVCKQIARSLRLRVSQVELTQGGTSSQKKILLRNVRAEEVWKSLRLTER